MRITQEADYALRITYLLAKHGGKLDSVSISEATGVTERFTVKILRKLVGGGLIVSHKGVKGGYELALPPAEVNMRRVIETIDGKTEISRCLDCGYECTRMGDQKCDCAFHLIFDKINSDLADKLESVTLASVLDEGTGIETILKNL